MEPAASKLKILFVEDDVFMIELLVNELIKAGFDASNAKTGAEALIMFKKQKPDLVLLDLLLPDQHGFDVLATIRRDPEGRDIKVIVLSNLSEDRDKERAKQLGVLTYLVKANNSLPEIVDAVRAVLKKA